MDDKKIKRYIFIFLFLVIIIIYFESYILNKDFNRVFFINDKNEMIRRYNSSTPIKMIVSMKYLSFYEIKDPDFIFDIWERINKLPVYNYISPSTEKENYKGIFGKIYFLDGSIKYFEIEKNIKINDMIYGTENNEDLQYIKERLKEKLFLPINLASEVVNENNKVIAFNHEKGVYIEDYKNKKRLYKILTISEKVASAKIIGKILEDNNIPLFKIKILNNNKEFLQINVLNNDYFTIYYLNTFLYMMKGNILTFLKNLF
ncbi:hypothetical protein XO12_06550 [Marinitoga sp. 1154]|uniref:DUF3919 family protein n=1 Tax=Marinitoga sp. 1154 TaxID=1643335 RepID=UPI001586BB24|nr:DUF3919 family protein [Marinitoga sp. 1154]NUU99767.1 hypothetical protein [Marinitoga sp. 1154]